ncbi:MULTISPECIES: AMP-binding protein [unclassified Dietzia]|uniref:AMP-binding protein n=1 Tax=unclassified Dietzia TaxID=2617939 RepID=UPI0015FC3F58|nr:MULTISPECIES: AMP-binding protein [unclassified Dietzia]MBB1040563.1 AMP-binding protein [Dietzia sp. Cai40]MBB1045031.1 AMP-binding protein [Dietzia sp. DQ11-44]MBB1050095.1 AMP-binding protein [Dietzia sp. CW19]
MAPLATDATTRFRAARDFLQANAEDYEAARAGFAWPELDEWNWALNWFDVEAEGNTDPALWIVEEHDGGGAPTEAKYSFDEVRIRSDRTANWLREAGVGPGDRILLMLANQVELWDVMLAVIKLGAVVIPATTLLAEGDLRDRIARGGIKHVIARSELAERFAAISGDYQRFAVGGAPDGWTDLAGAMDASPDFEPSHTTHADDTLLLYFTSGTTSKPKLVEHTHASYPAGHLSTMYWIGLQPGDVHLNVSSPGWAKHAWSNVFTPWIAGSCVFIYNYSRFDATAMMREMDRCGVSSLCCPPTVWRMLIQADLTQLQVPPRLAVGAGEPLNPEVIGRVRDAWGVTIRDGFGQTETTVQIANTPGQPIKDGSMGRPCPGFDVVLVDPATGQEVPGEGAEGEICLRLDPRPLGLMVGYHGDKDRTDAAYADGFYHTGDVGSRDSEGYITYVGRTDDVFKSSDYRISPFELESVLLEHPAVAEAAVVPSPDPVRLSVPKAFVVLAGGWEPTEETARQIFDYSRTHLAGYKRVRRLQFTDLPKTISGKIRRVELRNGESENGPSVDFPGEFREESLR